MAPSAADLFDNLLKVKFDGTNFVDWYHSLSVFLKHENKFYVLESPVPKEPPATATKSVMDAWMKHKDDSSYVACLMLLTMISNLQTGMEHFGAYEMLNRLKEKSRLLIRLEQFETVKELLDCKMVEGSSVGSHVLKMKSCIERLERLGSPMQHELATFWILASLPESYGEFVQNFINNNWEMSISDLHMMLKIVEKNKKSKSSQALGIREGRVMKPQVEAKGMGRNKKGVPSKQVSKTKERPAKDDIATTVGKWDIG